MAFALNVLLAEIDELNEPSGPTPNDCSSAPYNEARDVYVCTQSEAETLCDCPTGPLSSWLAEAGNDCFDFVNNAGLQGKCLPSTIGDCQLQNCPCTS